MLPPSGTRPIRAVVVSWNGAHLLRTCLDSLEAQTLRTEMEIVVVDNASTDGTAQLLAEHYPAVRRLATARNLGFAGGAATGMSGFHGEWVVLLNNDATFAPDAVERLRDAMTSPGAERLGATTAKILLTPRTAPDGRRLVNSTGNIITRGGTGADRDWLRPEGEESTTLDVFGFCGGAALLRQAALDDVGGFDPSLFLYYEDTDLSWRLRAAGWRIAYVPGAVAEHRHAASSGTDSPVFRYYNTRNSLLVFTRHAPAGVVLASSTRQLAGLLRAGAADGWSAPGTRARARGLLDHARLLPRTLAQRRALWSGAEVPRREVARYLRPAEAAATP